jgi:hypothetical protein
VDVTSLLQALGFFVSTLFTSCIFAPRDGICLPFPTCYFCLNFLVVITPCCIDDNQACHQRHLINLMNFFQLVFVVSVSTLVLEQANPIWIDLILLYVFFGRK